MVLAVGWLGVPDRFHVHVGVMAGGQSAAAGNAIPVSRGAGVWTRDPQRTKGASAHTRLLSVRRADRRSGRARRRGLVETGRKAHVRATDAEHVVARRPRMVRRQRNRGELHVHRRHERADRRVVGAPRPRGPGARPDPDVGFAQERLQTADEAQRGRRQPTMNPAKAALDLIGKPVGAVSHALNRPSSMTRNAPLYGLNLLDALRGGSLEDAVRDRIVLITGASSGIGAVTARRIGEAHGEVVLVARGREKLNETAAAVKQAGGEAHVYPCDLTDLDAIEAMAGQVLADLGRVDILINNAGKSIRRSLKLSYDRMHDYQRT